MRHRICFANGLGNPASELLSNSGVVSRIIKKMLKEAIKTFKLMREYEGVDYDIESRHISFGIEPAYMYEKLEIVSINLDIEKSYWETGIAWGDYGSSIASKKKYYSDYKYNGKFKKFIDKWHNKIFKIT